MSPFYGCGSSVSRLRSNYKETVYFLPQSLQEYLVLTSSSLEGWKAASTLKSPGGFEPATPRLEIQTIALAQDPKVLGSNPNYMLGQTLRSQSKDLCDHWIIWDKVHWSTLSEQDCFPTNVVDQSWPWDSQKFLYIILTQIINQASRSELCFTRY